MTLAWGASSGATAYDVKYGTSTGSYSTTLTNQTSPVVITGLANGTLYYFMVVAKNLNPTNTNATAEVTGRPVDPPGTFAFSGATAGNNQVALTWGASTGATSYDVKYGTSTGAYPTTFTNTAGTSATVTGLTNGTTYYFMVTAKNTGTATRNADAETSAAPAALPGAFAISSSSAGNTQVTLTWGASSGATSYTVKYGTTTGSYPTTASTNATSPFDVTGLTNGTPYFFMVTAVNGVGSTDASPEATATPAPPPGTFAITGTTAGDGQVALTWGASANASSYDVKYGTSTGSYPSTFTNTAGTSTTVTGLANGTTYYFMVTAKNTGATTQDATAESSAMPVPPVPGAFTISAAQVGNTQVTLTWGASSGAASYTVKYGTSTGSYPTTASTNATSPYTVTGLTNGTIYYFMVTAVNLNPTSTNAGAEATATPVAPPGAFAITGATPGSTQVALTWGASSGATSYDVKYGTTTGSYPTTFTNTAGTSTTVTGLTNGTTYYFMVTAKNTGVTTTDASAETSATPAGVPGAFSINSAAGRKGLVVLEWGASTGATSYTVKYGTSTGVYGTTLTNQTSPKTVTGLTNGTPYYFMVTAVNVNGSTDAGAEFSATPRHTIFVTDLAVTTALSFPFGPPATITADGLCQSDNNKPSGGGTFKALIVDSTRTACTSADCGVGGATENVDWVIAPSTTYARPSGTVIGTTSASGIFAFPLTAAISATATSVMTGLNTNWTNATDNCLDWTSADGGDSLSAGNATVLTSSAIASGTTSCGSYPLICVEQ